MPEKLSREQLIAKAKKHIATFQKPGRSDTEVAELAVAQLYSDNFKLRTRLRDADSRAGTDGDSAKTIARLEREIEEKDREIEELERQLPGDGTVTLSKEDAAELKLVREALAEHKLEAKALKDRLKAASDDATYRAEQTEKKRFADAAKAFGYDEEVLADIIASKKLHLEMKEVRRKKRDEAGNELDETETVSLPHVRVAANDKEPLTQLDEYVTKNLAKYAPSLTAKGESDEGTRGSNGTTRGGVKMPAQPGERGKPAAPAANVTSGYVERTYQTPSQRRAASKAT